MSVLSRRRCFRWAKRDTNYLYFDLDKISEDVEGDMSNAISDCWNTWDIDTFEKTMSDLYTPEFGKHIANYFRTETRLDGRWMEDE